eukprot:4671929-Pleurochrysis_carterae.AAC.2
MRWPTRQRADGTLPPCALLPRPGRRTAPPSTSHAHVPAAWRNQPLPRALPSPKLSGGPRRLRLRSDGA